MDDKRTSAKLMVICGACTRPRWTLAEKSMPSLALPAAMAHLTEFRFAGAGSLVISLMLNGDQSPDWCYPWG
jgi:hypothetical protein